jgi:hypothetical protein
VMTGHAERDRTGCEDEIRAMFPDVDVAAIMDHAIAADLQDELELDEQIERDERAARAAEHDLTKTMHQEDV